MERKSDDTTSRRREVVADRAGEAPAPGAAAVEPGLATLVTKTSLILPSNLQFEEWVEFGQALIDSKPAFSGGWATIGARVRMLMVSEAALRSKDIAHAS